MPQRYLSHLRVRKRQGARHAGLLLVAGRALPCAIGRAGFTRAKREGDGATPCGMLRPGWLWRRGRPVPTGLPWRLTQPADGWCDDPADRRYNRPVRLPCRASHERMWRDDALYDAVIELDWNRWPAVRGRGSAIFLHVARPGFAPTEGCVALRRADLLRLLPRLGPRTRLMIG